ncbi:MAG TPA: phosphoadenylyl-sulfate reductase [Xanthobacteraceae bacterium]|nr:phosphoadenylyl-sulfate reductase [Xanthobacteraceae bacterium]
MAHQPDPASLARALSAALPPLDLSARLAAARAQIPGRLVFTTSFGLEDQAIAHAIFAGDLPIEVVSLDTGRLFPETYDLWVETERRYGTRIRAFFPALEATEALVQRQGFGGFRASLQARHACCHVRKVEPLSRALKGASGWITGLRAGQSPNRAETPAAAFDAERDLVKINPLFDWTRERAVSYVREHSIPYNVLHDSGFLSIGCAPCTRAVAPGEPERAGRWWWESESQKECGLHLAGAAETSKATP